MNLFLIFLTGLTTGGLSCMTMQGGLLASVIANQKTKILNSNNLEIKSDSSTQSSRTSLSHEKAKIRDHFEKKPFSTKIKLLDSLQNLNVLPVFSFLFAKLLSHAILGLLLGLLGTQISLNENTKLAFQTFAAIFMFATAMNLLNAHPIFRYIAFQPPKFLNRFIRSTTRSQQIFAPAMLGFLTIFIPCGVTQAMEVLAINSASPITGALIMISFVLGTFPIFATIGIATAHLSQNLYQQFSRLAAISLLAMSLYSLNGVLIVTDAPVSSQKLATFINDVFFYTPSKTLTDQNQPNINIANTSTQKVIINVLNNGYSPNYIKVNRNQPVELTLKSTNTYSCALSFILKEFDINTFLAANDSQTYNFTPTKPGKFIYTCSMGMYTGTLEVI